MSWTIICLGPPLPAASSDPPESEPGKLTALFSVLLRMGFTWLLRVTTKTVVSYTAFPPLRAAARGRCFRGIFLLHWPGSHLHRTLSGILPCEARTFLTCALSGHAAAIVCPAYFLKHFTRGIRCCQLISVKQPPPTNSRRRELVGTEAVSTPTKYSRNLRSLLAS